MAQHRRSLRLVAVKCIHKRALKGREALLENEIAVLRKSVLFFPFCCKYMTLQLGI